MGRHGYGKGLLARIACAAPVQHVVLPGARTRNAALFRGRSGLPSPEGALTESTNAHDGLKVPHRCALRRARLA